MEVNVEKTKRELLETNNNLKNSQKEYIAILGIFAAIVLAFTGGITFSTSVLENIHKVSIYRAIVISLLIGFVLTNTIYTLFYYVNKLVNGNNIKKIYPLLISNAIIIISIILTILAWNFGFVEKRNKNMIRENNVSLLYMRKQY